MPTRSALTPGSFLVLAGRFLLILFPLAVASFVVFNVGVYRFSALAEYEQPGSLETPLSGAGPLLAAAFTSILLDIAVLAYLTHRRVLFAKFFLVLLSVGTASLVATYYIEVTAAIHFNGWYPAGSNPAPEYPVLVITPDEQTGGYRAEVIQWQGLADFRRENPEYSFLVPEGQDAVLQSQMPRDTFVKRTLAHQESRTDAVSARFEVTRLRSGRQKLIVSGSWYRNQNASVRSWYEAEAHQVYPKYMNEGDTYGIYHRDAFLLVASVDLAGLGFYLRRRWKKPRALRTAVATQ